MEPNALTNEFKEFLKLLNDHEVEYLIVGGHAVAYHGYPRSTGDLDVWVSVNAHNAKKTCGGNDRFRLSIRQCLRECIHGA